MLFFMSIDRKVNPRVRSHVTREIDRVLKRLSMPSRKGLWVRLPVHRGERQNTKRMMREIFNLAISTIDLAAAKMWVRRAIRFIAGKTPRWRDNINASSIGCDFCVADVMMDDMSMVLFRGSGKAMRRSDDFWRLPVWRSSGEVRSKMVEEIYTWVKKFILGDRKKEKALEFIEERARGLEVDCQPPKAWEMWEDKLDTFRRSNELLVSDDKDKTRCEACRRSAM